MVGGIVVKVFPLGDTGETWLLVHENDTYDTCGVIAKDPEGDRKIQVGDQVWWQAGIIYWTPASYGDHGSDLQLKKVGGSGVTLLGAKENRNLL